MIKVSNINNTFKIAKRGKGATGVNMCEISAWFSVNATGFGEMCRLLTVFTVLTADRLRA
ncbi:MAG: hypothetical protein LBQ68_05460 [Clostridiales bacterium]|nr:hypothetical protein [Clostridiales bacterium]